MFLSQAKSNCVFSKKSQTLVQLQWNEDTREPFSSCRFNLLYLFLQFHPGLLRFATQWRKLVLVDLFSYVSGGRCAFTVTLHMAFSKDKVQFSILCSTGQDSLRPWKSCPWISGELQPREEEAATGCGNGERDGCDSAPTGREGEVQRLRQGL